jgi:hypothetical protein
MTDAEKLALAMKALELADSIMGYSRGDAWERGATESQYDEFNEIYAKLAPREPEPAPVTSWSEMPRRGDQGDKEPCPDCGKKFFNVAAHARAKHGKD